MAQLDYAFLADYAQIEGGKLSALGASFTHAQATANDSLWITSIAGRVRAIEGETPHLEVKVVAPGGVFEIDSDAVLEAGD
ncbi:MAG TPA: hypothetical protein VL294_11270, partial [Pseudolysinimonas sp.]|nr:hypothetical protein [Pseudolysinimonas sp.]